MDGPTGELADAAPSAGRRAAQAVAARVQELFSAAGLAFRDLAVTHAASTAGDTLVAVGLAGTLFFGVPSSEARGNVALYLLLTVAPFALVGPVLGILLDRYPSAYRRTLLWSAGARAALVLLVAFRTDTLWLFPAAFGLLVLSRVHGISRTALLPLVLPERHALVAAGGRLAWIGVLAGAAAAVPGALLAWLAGPPGPMLLAAAAFVVAALAGRRLPRPPAAPGRQVHGLRVPLPRPVRLAQLATAVVRLLNGFLLLLLAFAFRRQGAGVLDFGTALAAGGAGFAAASLAAPALERRLREEPMVVAALAVEAGAAFVAAQWFGLAAAAALAAAAGFAWGTAKLAFDGLLQASLPPQGRGTAFTRSETLFQLAWVLGAVLPTALPLPTSLGLAAAGLAALAAQVVYVAQLLLPDDRRDRRA